MKPKYKVLIMYLIITYILAMFLLIVPQMTKIEYQEINISEPIGARSLRAQLMLFKNMSIAYGFDIRPDYRAGCRSTYNGEIIKINNQSFKNDFCTIAHKGEYKKILNIQAINAKKTKDIIIKQIDYIDNNDNIISFKIPENLFQDNIKHYENQFKMIWSLFIFAYIFTLIYFYRKNIFKTICIFFNKLKGN